MIIIIYWVLGYWAYGFVNKSKVYIYREGQLFRHKLIMGLAFGWFFIPWAVLKMLLGR